jgi:uncharacterized protein (DUF983 family)
MSENCAHKPDVRFGEFIRRYFKKDGILAQTYRCKLCGGDIHFVKKPVYRVWDGLIWLVLLAFMFLARLWRNQAIALVPLWAYIVIAVAAVSLLGLVLDMAKEWALLKSGKFVLAAESQKPEEDQAQPVKEEAPEDKPAEDKPAENKPAE